MITHARLEAYRVRVGAGQVSQVSRQVRRDRRVPTGLRPENRNQSADTGAA